LEMHLAGGVHSLLLAAGVVIVLVEWRKSDVKMDPLRRDSIGKIVHKGVVDAVAPAFNRGPLHLRRAAFGLLERAKVRSHLWHFKVWDSEAGDSHVSVVDVRAFVAEVIDVGNGRFCHAGH